MNQCALSAGAVPGALAALEVATSWETWNTLRVGQHLSVPQAKTAMGVLVRGLGR